MGVARAKNNLCHAIDLNEVDQLMLILKNNPELVNCIISKDCNHTPLHRAIQKRNYTIANILLGDFGADPNFLVGRFTPLMLAATKDNSEIIELLLHFKADYLRRNQKGLTVVDYAFAYGSYRTLFCLKAMTNIPVELNLKNLSAIRKQGKQLQTLPTDYFQMQELLQRNTESQKALRLLQQRRKQTKLKLENCTSLTTNDYFQYQKFFPPALNILVDLLSIDDPSDSTLESIIKDTNKVYQKGTIESRDTSLDSVQNPSKEINVSSLID